MNFVCVSISIDDNNDLKTNYANCDETFFIVVSCIFKCNSVTIKNILDINKVNAVFVQVAFALGFIPNDVHDI